MATKLWIATTDGNWNNSNNWSPIGVPNSFSSSVEITDAGSVGTSVTIDSAGQGAASLTLDRSNFLRVTGPAAQLSVSGMTVVGQANAGSFLQIDSGATASLTGGLDIGSVAAGSPSVVSVDGPGSTLNLGSTVAIGSLSTGQLIVRNGAQLGGSGNMLIGSPTAVGNLQVGLGAKSGSLGSWGVVLGNINSTVSFNSTDDATFNNAISGNGWITIEGAGSVTLSGELTYSGSTFLSAGSTLTFSGSVAPTTSAIFNYGTVNFNFNGSTTYAQALTGRGDYNVNMLPFDTLSIAFGSNGYAGVTNVNSGTLEILVSGALGLNGFNVGTDPAVAGTVVTDGATLRLNSATGVDLGYEGLTLSGSGVSGAGALQSAGGNNIHFGPIFLAGDTRISTDAGLFTLQGNISGTGSNLNFYANGNVTVTGNLSLGAGALIKDGFGTLTVLKVSGAPNNVYSGGTTVNAGTLEVWGDTRLSTGAVNLAGIGVVLRLYSVLGLSNDIEFGPSATIDVLAFYDSTISGGISGGSGFIKTGAGILTLSGNNTFTGTTVVNGGTLELRGGHAISDFGALQVNAGGILSLQDAETIASLAVNGGNASVNAVVNVGSLSGATGAIQLNSAATLVVGSAGGTSNFGSVISGNGSLQKTGTGTFTLTGLNSYSGPTTVSGGLLSVIGTGSIASNSVFVSGGVLATDSDALAAGVTLHVSGTGLFTSIGTDSYTGINQTGGTINGTGVQTLSGLFIQSGGGTSGSVTINAAGFTQSGDASIGAGTTVTSSGQKYLQGGTIAGTLAGAGAVIVNSFISSVTGAGVIDTTNVTIEYGGTLVTDGGALGVTTHVNLNGFWSFLGIESIGAVFGSGGVSLSTGSVLELNAGEQVFSGSISGSGSLNIRGGVTTLTGNNSYSGLTFIDGAKLVLSGAGSISASSQIIMNGSSIFDISGTESGVMINHLLYGGSGNPNIILGGKSLTINLPFPELGSINFTGGTGLDKLKFEMAALQYWVDISGATFTNWTAGVDTITLNGNELNNELTGTSQSDAINGLAGVDILNGLDGDDILSGGRSIAGQQNQLNGGNGSDTADYSAETVAVYADLRINSGYLALGGTYVHTDTFSAIENLTGGRESDILVGNDGVANTIRGGDGIDILYGLGGDDILSGGRAVAGQQNLLDGGTGNDTADYSFETVTVYADLRFNTGSLAYIHTDNYVSIENITGGSADDILVGDDAVGNVIKGGAGNDMLYGLGGTDSLFGLEGNDFLSGGLANAGQQNSLDGGTGNDTADYSFETVTVYADLRFNTGSLAYIHTDNYVSIENITGGSADDILVGDDTNGNVIKGGAGTDALYGLGGDDVLSGGLAAAGQQNTLDGGTGNDTADYSAEIVTVYADLRFNTGSLAYIHTDNYVSIENITGGSADDILVGDDTNGNVIKGGAGTDALYGLGGDDVLSGGLAAAGQQNTLDGGTGNDTADYSAEIVTVYADLRFNTGSLAYIHTDNYVSIENITGGSADDILVGDSGSNRIQGGAGADALYADATATDDATGDAAPDYFIFASASDSNQIAGTDTIYNFVSGQDKIDLSALDLTPADLFFSFEQGSLYILADTNNNSLDGYEFRVKFAEGFIVVSVSDLIL